MITASAEFGGAPYVQTIAIREHRLTADEGPQHGAADTGPSPTELLLGALASCITVTVQMYARRKGCLAARPRRRERPGRTRYYVIERRVVLGATSPTSSGRASPTSPAAVRCRNG